MNVLVTGATGFIGSHVCRALLAAGHHVHAVIEPGADRGRLLDIHDLLRTTELDLFHAGADELTTLAHGMDSTIHCAWYAVPGKYLIAPENIEAINGSLNFFSALWRNGCHRIVGIGTCVEYALGDQPLCETAPLNPTTLYAAAKLSTFLTGRELARQLGGSLAWARLFYLYGPHETPSRLVPDLAINLLQGKRVAVTDGQQVRDYLHVEDVASALVAIAHADEEGAFNVGSGVAVTVRHLVETVARTLQCEHLVDYGARPANLLDPPYIVADSMRLQKTTHWRPRYSLPEGLLNTLAWWKHKLSLDQQG